MNGDIESAVRTMKAQMRATRFGLESRLGSSLRTMIRFLCGYRLLQVTRSRDSGKVPMARHLGNESRAESGLEIHWSLVSASS